MKFSANDGVPQPVRIDKCICRPDSILHTKINLSTYCPTQWWEHSEEYIYTIIQSMYSSR